MSNNKQQIKEYIRILKMVDAGMNSLIISQKQLGNKIAKEIDKLKFQETKDAAQEMCNSIFLNVMQAEEAIKTNKLNLLALKAILILPETGGDE